MEQQQSGECLKRLSKGQKPAAITGNGGGSFDLDGTHGVGAGQRRHRRQMINAFIASYRLLANTQSAVRETLPMRKPATGEPYAGKPLVRFGGRGGHKPFPTPIMGRRRNAD